MNSSLLSIYNIFILNFDFTSTYKSQIWNISTNLFLLWKYKVFIFFIFLHKKMAIYEFFYWYNRLCSPQKSACIFSKLSITINIFLYYLITLMNLLVTYIMHSLLKLLFWLVSHIWFSLAMRWKEVLIMVYPSSIVDFNSKTSK